MHKVGTFGIIVINLLLELILLQIYNCHSALN